MGPEEDPYLTLPLSLHACNCSRSVQSPGPAIMPLVCATVRPLTYAVILLVSPLLIVLGVGRCLQ